MFNQLSYQVTAHDDYHLKKYSDYQKRYAKTMRESDKKLIEVIQGLVESDLKKKNRPALLDIGCSTGNLLFHLSHGLSGVDLFGGDIVPSVIAECKKNPGLAGVQFSEMDMLHLDHTRQFDLVVANASMMFFGEEEFDRAIQNIAAVTRKGGWFVAFDFFHPFQQEISIVETSKLHPEGLQFHFRGYSKVKVSLERARFSNPTFTPFSLPIDLPKPSDLSDITSYTVRSDEGKKMPFRGVLFQPWCYLVAQKGS